MDTKFLNSDNSKTSDPQRLLFDLSDTINLKISDKYLALSNFIKSHKNNQFGISAPTWNEEFELLDGSYSISDNQDYFKYIFKNTRQLQIMLQ